MLVIYLFILPKRGSNPLGESNVSISHPVWSSLAHPHYSDSLSAPDLPPQPVVHKLPAGRTVPPAGGTVTAEPFASVRHSTVPGPWRSYVLLCLFHWEIEKKQTMTNMCRWIGFRRQDGRRLTHEISCPLCTWYCTLRNNMYGTWKYRSSILKYDRRDLSNEHWNEWRMSGGTEMYLVNV